MTDTPTRATRADTTREEDVNDERRRRRSDGVSDPSLSRFHITEDALDRKKFVYRSVADNGNRLLNLTQNDDYNFCTFKGERASGADADGVARYRSGTNLDGSPQYTYLLRKLKQWADEDRTQRLDKVDRAEKARLTETPDDAPDKSYTPKR